MSSIINSRARKAQVFGGILTGVIIILFVGHLLPGFADTAPSPARVVDLICPPDCPDGIQNPQDINQNQNGTSTISFDPNPPVTSLDSLLLQLADNVQSPILPKTDSVVITAIVTLEDSVGNQKISIQQTELPQQNIVQTGQELQTLNNGRLILNFIVESNLPSQTFFITGKLLNEDKSININLVDSGTTDDEGNFQVEINNSPAIIQGIFGNKLIYSFSMQDIKILISGIEFGFDGVQQIYKLDVTVDGNGFIRFDNDSTEPLRFLPADGELIIKSKMNEQFETITCLVSSENQPDCIGEQTNGNIKSYQAPSLATVTLNGDDGGFSGLDSGQTIIFELNRNSNYTLVLGLPFNQQFDFQTPKSQKTYTVDCWNYQNYNDEFMAVTNGTQKTSTLDGMNKLTCDSPE